MRKEFIKRILCLIMAVIVAVLLIACGANTEPEETKRQTVNNQTSVNNAEFADVPDKEQNESNGKMRGMYTLDNCKGMIGVYVAYEDGSFDMCTGGGYCYGLISGGNMFHGMFMRDVSLVYAKEIDKLSKEKRLVVFCNTDYSLTLHPIHAEAACFVVESSDGDVKGYGRLSQITEMGAPIDILYVEGEREDINPIYIDGKPAKEYNAETVKWSVNPFKGMSGTSYTYQLWGFKKGTNVKIGVGKGTALVEKEYEVNSTYYDCEYDRNNWEDEDIYHIEGLATPEGYAEVDLSNVPKGKYVMLFQWKGTYRANILTIV